MAPPRRESIGETLIRLRRSVRLSREGLARAAGVASSTLRNIEEAADPRTGKAPESRTGTYEQIARGLAKDPLTGDVDEAQAQRFLHELKLAAGYVATVVAELRIDPPDEIRAQAASILAEYPDIETDIAETGHRWTEYDLTLLRAALAAARERQRLADELRKRARDN